MGQLLDVTGYSFSGISDLIQGSPEQVGNLLIDINDEYSAVKLRMARLEKELQEATSLRGLLVTAFVNTHSALKLGDNPLCFTDTNKTVVVEIKDFEQKKIDYNEFYHTKLPA